MNSFLPSSINEKKVGRILTVLFLLLCISPTVLNIACLTPLYFNLENNTLYSGSAITLTLKYVMDLFDLISFSSVYALIIFSLVILKKRHTVALSVGYVCLLLLKIPARLVMNIPLYGTIGTAAEIIADMLSLSFYFILELAQFAIVLIIAVFIAKSYLNAISYISSSKKQKKGKALEIEHILPIKAFFNWNNPLLRSTIFMSAVIILFKVTARIITDIGAGAPTLVGEVMIMIVNYLTDAIYGAVAYIIAILVFNLLFEKIAIKSDEKKNKTDDNSQSALFED